MIGVIAVDDGKVSVVIGVTEHLNVKIDAVILVKRAVAELGGPGGGGRPDMAQGGGPDGAKADSVLAAIRQDGRRGVDCGAQRQEGV